MIKRCREKMSTKTRLASRRWRHEDMNVHYTPFDELHNITKRKEQWMGMEGITREGGLTKIENWERFLHRMGWLRSSIDLVYLSVYIYLFIWIYSSLGFPNPDGFGTKCFEKLCLWSMIALLPYVVMFIVILVHVLYVHSLTCLCTQTD